MFKPQRMQLLSTLLWKRKPPSACTGVSKFFSLSVDRSYILNQKICFSFSHSGKSKHCLVVNGLYDLNMCCLVLFGQVLSSWQMKRFLNHPCGLKRWNFKLVKQINLKVKNSSRPCEQYYHALLQVFQVDWRMQAIRAGIGSLEVGSPFFHYHETRWNQAFLKTLFTRQIDLPFQNLHAVPAMECIL